MRVLQILVLTLGLAVFGNAQTTKETATLTGLVYDDNGAVIPGATINFRGNNKVERTVYTNEDGIFEIKLETGNYSIRVASSGFQSFEVGKFRIAPSYKGKMNLDVALEVGPCDGCHMIEVDATKENKSQNKFIKERKN